MEFLGEYGLFLAKWISVLLGLLLLISMAVGLSARRKPSKFEQLEVNKLNDDLEDMKHLLQHAVLDKNALKAVEKEEKKAKKQKEKQQKKQSQEECSEKRVYVLSFDGDVQASEVENLSHTVTTVLTLARMQDEIVVRLESGGGFVHSYGLAASQLARIKSRGVPLTVCVDKIAASGGYMMACVADKIVAAPFAIIGSIGVVGQTPNFNRLLKKHDIDYELHTAGDYKRTLTMLGENTDKGRQKFIEELEETHQLFKQFIKEFRPAVNIDGVATGEIWFGRRALENKLIDEVSTSDDYLVSLTTQAEVYEVKLTHKKTLAERLGLSVQLAIERVLLTSVSWLSKNRFFS